MPPARGQSAEQRRLGGFAIEVKRLRIELRRECLDLRGIDRMRRAREALAYTQIFEEKPVRADLPGSVIALVPSDALVLVTCIMIVTNLR